METIQRMPVCRKLTKQQREWLDTNCCPMCGLPKRNWKRRTDWTCCSTDCTKKYSDEHIFVWQYWKVKAFERDNYTCVKCGDNRRDIEVELRYGEREWIETRNNLIADHIIPIAIGGEEYDLDNVQTLCLKCNKEKTKKDLKSIVLYRKKEKSQTELNSEAQHSSHA